MPWLSFDEMKNPQKLSIWNYLLLILAGLSGIGILIFLLFALFFIEQDIYIVVFEFLLFIGFIISVMTVYVNYSYIVMSVGKSIRKLSKGHYEYLDEISKFSLTNESIDFIQLYIPGSYQSPLATTFIKIHMKSGDRIFFNSFVCDPDFFRYDLNDIPLKTEIWKLKDLKKLIRED